MAGQFLWQVRVYYEDTDAAGMVFYANYLRYMERARTEWLRHVNHPHDILNKDYGVFFAVTKVNIHYQLPACLDDYLNIISELAKVGAASIDFKQWVKRDELLICQAEVKVACLDVASKKPKAIPVQLLEALNGT